MARVHNLRESDAHTHKTYKPLMSGKNKAAVPYKVPFGTPFLPKISGNVALVLHIYSNVFVLFS